MTGRLSIKQRQIQQYVSSGQASRSLEARSAREHFRTSAPYIQSVIANHFPKDRTARIVDLGCGHGPYVYHAQELGYSNIRGIDASSEQVALARKLGVMSVECGDAWSSIQAESMVSLFLMIDVLEHLTPQQADELLSCIVERLAPEGRLILHVPNAEGIFGQRVRYGDLTHETCFTRRSLGQLLKPLGFSRIRCYEDRPLAKNLKGVVRRLIWDIGTSPFRLLLAAETGALRGAILSQNMLVIADR